MFPCSWCVKKIINDLFILNKFLNSNHYFLGVCAYALAVILGITSLPSVTNVLTWKEFAFIQSKLGWLCLIFGCAHTLFFSWPRLTSVQCNFFLHGAQVAA